MFKSFLSCDNGWASEIGESLDSIVVAVKVVAAFFELVSEPGDVCKAIIKASNGINERLVGISGVFTARLRSFWDFSVRGNWGNISEVKVSTDAIVECIFLFVILSLNLV